MTATIVATFIATLMTIVVGLATNTASSEHNWPGPFRLAQEYPWASLGAGAAITAVLGVLLALLTRESPKRDHRKEPDRESFSGALVLRTLPRDTPIFVNREPELARLTQLVEKSQRAGDPIPVQAIDGMAGAGKTSLAVHAGHLLKGRFPDGQLFVNLNGYTPGRSPVAATDTLASLLIASGLDPQEIPSGTDPDAVLEARAAVWRDRLADRQVLLILDNAIDNSQIEPLLPGYGGSLVLVTSRRRLAVRGEMVTQVGALAPATAADLFCNLSGRVPEDLDRAAVERVVQMCGWLPLAISLLTARFRNHPAWTVTGVESRMAASHDRLSEIRSGDWQVAAAFDLSYRDLPPSLQKFFRRLGQFPGSTIDAYAAAALTMSSLVQAERELESLYDDHLLEEGTPGNYHLHDLLRNYAQVLAKMDEDAVREDSNRRLTNYYLKTIREANKFIVRPGEVINYGQTKPMAATPDIAIPPLSDRGEALAWLESEKDNILACIEDAHHAGRHSAAVQLTAFIAPFLRLSGPWDQAADLYKASIDHARLQGDIPAVANGLANLGTVYRLMADYPRAITALTESLDLYRATDDRLGEGSALNQLGIAQYLTAEYAAAERSQAEALAISRASSYRLGAGNALADMGMILRKLSRYEESAVTQREALMIYRELGDRYGEANALRDLGVVLSVTGDYAESMEQHSAALDLYKYMDDRLHQAYALNELGVVRRLTGDKAGAQEAAEEALEIYTKLGDRYGQANSIRLLGVLDCDAGRITDGQIKLQDCLVRYSDLGNHHDQAETLNELGMAALVANNASEAISFHERALVLFRELGSKVGEVMTLNGLGEAFINSDLNRAIQHYRPALQMATDINFPLGTANAHIGIGRIEKAAGRRQAAADSFRSALALYQHLGMRERMAVVSDLLADTDASA